MLQCAPVDMVMLGTSADTGRTLLCAAAFRADLGWMDAFFQAATSMPAAASLLPGCVLQPDVHGLLPLHYAIAKAQPAAVSLLLEAALQASPHARRRLAEPIGSGQEHATPAILELLADLFPRLLASCIGKLPLDGYPCPPAISRAPPNLLSCCNGALEVKGSNGPYVARDFWADKLKGAADAEDEVDVHARLQGVPGLSDGGDLFVAVVMANLPELITSPAMRVVIAFKCVQPSSKHPKPRLAERQNPPQLSL